MTNDSMLANNCRFIPLPPQVFFIFCPPPQAGFTDFCLPGADGAAALLRAGAGVDDRLPHVAVGTLSPHFFVASGSHHLRRQRAVE